MYDVAALRTRIPALSGGTAFFDGPGGTQTPAEVAAAIAGALIAPLANRGTVTEAARNAEAIVHGARHAIADLLGTDPRGVVFGRSMTQLAYDLARALADTWTAGDEIVVTRLDHDAHIRPWVQAAARRGVTLRFADFAPETGELTVEHIAAQLTDRTRLVAVTGASNLIGTRPPLPRIAAVVHGAGALLSVDAVHLAAHVPLDRTGLGADLLFCSPYKLLGPHCGVVAADPALLENLRPDKLAPATDAVPERFELGTLPYELLAGVSAAVDVLASLAADASHPSRRARLLDAMAKVEAQEDALHRQLEVGLECLHGVTRHGRAGAGPRTPTELLTFADREATEVAAALAARDINAPAGSFYALEASRALGLGDGGGLRIGLAPYSDATDIARLLDALAELLSPAARAATMRPMEHEHTQFIAAAPDAVYAVLGDIKRLPEFVPQMTSVSSEGEHVAVHARYEGHEQQGEGWFKADPDTRRIEWGSDSSPYHGWMQIDADGDGSRLTLFLATARGDAPDSEVMGTLDAIRRLVESQV